MHSRIMKVTRNVLISVGILLVLFVGGGVAYTWFMGQYNNTTPVVTPQIDHDTPSIKHASPAPNAKVGASVQTITSPIMPGSNASIIIKTNPGATCTITVVYDNTPSKDSGLNTKVADDFGVINWTWTVEDSVPFGKWPVTVTCSAGKQSAVVIGDLIVAKSLAD